SSKYQRDIAVRRVERLHRFHPTGPAVQLRNRCTAVAADEASLSRSHANALPITWMHSDAACSTPRVAKDTDLSVAACRSTSKTSSRNRSIVDAFSPAWDRRRRALADSRFSASMAAA